MRSSTRRLTASAAVGALYVVLSLLSSALNLAYGPIQCRFSEALCVLPFLLPSSVWGLAAGCLLVNILSPYGPLDMAVGTLATLLAALWTRRCRRPGTAALPPVLCNGVLIGGLIAFETTNFGGGFLLAFLYNAATVALGEAAACYLLGLPLLRWLSHAHFFTTYLDQKQED